MKLCLPLLLLALTLGGFLIKATAQSPKESPNATLINVYVTVTVNRSRGEWEAVWKDGTAIKGVQFSAEVNAANIIISPVESTSRPFSDPLGKAQELKQRYGLKLGLWISPTDVADTSEFYQQHPDWMLNGEDGKAKVNWKWFWKPNPNCYQLDTTRPEAFDHVANVFKQLVAEDVSYFKIDFISSQGKESFSPNDPKSTRGWSVFRRTLQAVRAGAGEAWVRYCQAPPLI